MKKAILVLPFAMLAAGSVFAQTCASPIEVTSNNSNGAFAAPGATTCGAGNNIDPFPGGAASPQQEIVYSFVANNADATISIDSSGGALQPGLVVMNACNETAEIVAVADSAAPGPIQAQVSGLTNGATYYVVVTSRIGAPDDNCGPFTGTIAGELPVSLQNFSVE